MLKTFPWLLLIPGVSGELSSMACRQDHLFSFTSAPSPVLWVPSCPHLKAVLFSVPLLRLDTKLGMPPALVPSLTHHPALRYTSSRKLYLLSPLPPCNSLSCIELSALSTFFPTWSIYMSDFLTKPQILQWHRLCPCNSWCPAEEVSFETNGLIYKVYVNQKNKLATTFQDSHILIL